ncbi:DUF5713 family protein [Variovorax sp. PAMC26660]|uniref:DUF5713 family protein n=1 Tax=Variovorax sp. PAMC26660 TaxID=2762322 RepID=UPI00164DE3B9|nr:DUF5713 family protein [Variovorax sp. PAMC26660]QNK66771.1 hypothetical protein H7F35_26880 [Variovorax sp. PAMC26660]
MPITNPQLLNHPFLQEMYLDAYFPDFLVDKCKQIFVRLCEAIEAQKPSDNASLLRLTHAATEEFNALAEEFDENGSELETAAREAIAADFETIAKAYGFDIDTEELISPRDW